MRTSLLALLLLLTNVAGHSHGGSHRGGHHYPPSSGYSGYSSHRVQAPHSYPPSSGLSGQSNSANVRQTYHQQHNTAQYNYKPKTEVHHHYHYSPPQQISYGSTYHPVYQGQPPVYVYQYQDSGSRFDTLLTGLALYNLGRNSHSHNYDSNRQYSSLPGEVCKLGISKRSGEYEETRIDCMLMSSFIWEDTTRTTQHQQSVTLRNTTEIKETLTTNGAGNNTNSSVTVVTVKSETVVDALKVKGPSIAVSPGMTCYMIRTYRDSTTTRKPVDCALLQEYARRSLYSSGSKLSISLMTILFNFLIYSVVYSGY